MSQRGGAELSDEGAQALRLCASGNFGSGYAGLGDTWANCRLIRGFPYAIPRVSPIVTRRAVAYVWGQCKTDSCKASKTSN